MQPLSVFLLFYLHPMIFVSSMILFFCIFINQPIFYPLSSQNYFFLFFLMFLLSFTLTNCELFLTFEIGFLILSFKFALKDFLIN